MNGFKQRLLIAAMGSLLASQAWAGVAEDAFAAGIKASRGGDYLYALTRFELAQREGMKSAALSYNLGVCYYRLGQYPQAEAAFRSAASNHEMKPLALYNLGLVALARKDPVLAEQMFLQSRDSATDAGVRALADRQLARLQQNSKDELWQWWLLSASANVGYDDNVLDPAEDVTHSRHDNFAELFALASGPVSGTLRDGVRVDVSAYALRYSELSEYDMNMLRGGAALRRMLGAWQGEGGLHYETSTLGNDSYLNTATLSLIASNRWREDTQLRLRYRYGAIDAQNTLYEPLQGTRQQLDVQNRWRQSEGWFLLSYQYELNDRDDYRGTTTFSSYSPTRHTLRAGLEQNLKQQWVGGLDVSLRDSRYADPNVLSSGREILRQDKQYQLRLRARRPLDKTWEATIEYSYTNNDSNISTYDYQRNLIMVGVAAQW